MGNKIKTMLVLLCASFTINAVNLNAEGTNCGYFGPPIVMLELFDTPSLTKNFTDKYNQKTITENLQIFQLHINTKNKCDKQSSAYCLINNNQKELLFSYIEKHKNTPIKIALLLDYAYRTNNKEMALFLTKQNIPSIHFPDRRSKIYAAVFYGYEGVAKFLLNDNTTKDIDFEYDNGLTLLGVSSLVSSFKTMQLLVEKGAIQKGKRFYNYKFIKSNLDAFEENQHVLYNLLKKQYTTKPIPKLLTNEAETSFSMSKNRLAWLENLFKENPMLFNTLLVNKKNISNIFFFNALFSTDERVFDFMIDNNVDLCNEFDENFDIKSWQNSISNNWLSKRYQQCME